MNTPTHILLALAVFDRAKSMPSGSINRFQHRWTLAILLGSLLPDPPMFIFYAWAKLQGIPESIIWSKHYYAEHWQLFFDIPNALPIVLLLLGFAFIVRSRTLLLSSAAIILHILCDLPLHHDDGHRHFWPFSDWVLQSPLSYWDPQHGGGWFKWVEIGLALSVAAISFWHYRQNQPNYWGKWLVLGLLLLYAGYAAYAIAVWG